jgi:hypothetical protein
MLARYVTGLIANSDRVLNKFDELGVSMNQPSDELVKATETFLAKDIATIAALGEKNYGLKNAQQKAERFVALLRKWEGLTADMPADWSKLGDIYRDEIFSKLDRSAFGL